MPLEPLGTMGKEKEQLRQGEERKGHRRRGRKEKMKATEEGIHGEKEYVGKPNCYHLSSTYLNDLRVKFRSSPQEGGVPAELLPHGPESGPFTAPAPRAALLNVSHR